MSTSECRMICIVFCWAKAWANLCISALRMVTCAVTAYFTDAPPPSSPRPWDFRENGREWPVICISLIRGMTRHGMNGISSSEDFNSCGSSNVSRRELTTSSGCRPGRRVLLTRLVYSCISLFIFCLTYRNNEKLRTSLEQTVNAPPSP